MMKPRRVAYAMAASKREENDRKDWLKSNGDTDRSGGLGGEDSDAMVRGTDEGGY